KGAAAGPLPTTAVVPPVANLTPAAAQTAITAAGFGFGGVASSENSATVPVGAVVRAIPASRTTLTLPASLSIVTSLGPAAPPPGGAEPTVSASVTINGRGNQSLTVTTAGPALLVAFVSADGPPLANAQSATVSSAGLAWSLVARSNAQFGTAEIWTATAA